MPICGSAHKGRDGKACHEVPDPFANANETSASDQLAGSDPLHDVTGPSMQGAAAGGPHFQIQGLIVCPNFTYHFKVLFIQYFFIFCFHNILILSKFNLLVGFGEWLEDDACVYQ